MAILPLAFRQTCRRLGILPTRFVLLVDVRRQRIQVVEPLPRFGGGAGTVRKTCRVSTSRFGLGQRKHSNCTPLGLHRVAQKIGGGWPTGAVFKNREMLGYTWAGRPGTAITNRILWLEGLEPGHNRGGDCDTFERFIYIHGTGNEPSLGRPASHGCIHLAAADLLPLYDAIPCGTLVWIDGNGASGWAGSGTVK